MIANIQPPTEKEIAVMYRQMQTIGRREMNHPAVKFLTTRDEVKFFRNRQRESIAEDIEQNQLVKYLEEWRKLQMSNPTATTQNQMQEVKYTGAQLMQEIAKLRSETKANADRNQANWTALVQDLEKAKRDLFHEAGQHRTEIASLKSQIAAMQANAVAWEKLVESIGEPEDRWTPEQRAAAQQTPTNGKKITRQTINITQIVKAVDDKGKEFYRAKGGRFMQFGIAIYPEALKACKIDPALLKFGPNDCDQGMIAEFEDDKPRRVIGLAKIF